MIAVAKIRNIAAPACLAALLVAPSDGRAQFFAHCRHATLDEFNRSSIAYEEHSFRLNQKFLDGYYHQGELPTDFSPVGLDEIQAYLGAIPGRSPALLFYAFSDSSVCSWLVSADDVVSAVVQASPGRMRGLSAALRESLGIAELERTRSPRRRGVSAADGESQGATSMPARAVLDELSGMLLSGKIRGEVAGGGYDTLLIAPVADLATLPLAALPLDDSRTLIDVASIVMLPGLFALSGDTTDRTRGRGPALVVGDPVAADREWVFPPLPGAREEARAVAEQLGTDPLIGEAATKSAVMRRLAAERGHSVIYLATHGIASRTDPRDASFLLLSRARWPAAEIQNLGLTNNPLVVLSACQTGLGKDFDIGTIGMARAWERAGASSVAMSLWNVDDQATKELMLTFMSRARTLPSDKALQQAMLSLRQRESSIAKWASFVIFGRPEAGVRERTVAPDS